jgi:cation:H+ antiporter
LFDFVSAVIVVAGYYLSGYGDVIAEKTGLSGSWVGLALVVIYLINSFALY